MSLTVLQGVFSGSSTTKARDLRQAWVGAFAGISGWTIKDNNYVNGTAERSVITNDISGFSLMLYNSTNTTDLRLGLVFGKEYNETTHSLIDIAFFNDSENNIITSTPEALSGVDFNPTSITNRPTNFRRVHDLKHISATSGQSDWIVVISETKNTAILTMNDGTSNIGKAIYFGEYTDLINNPELETTYPYVCSIVSSENVGATGVVQSVGNPSTLLAGRRFSARSIYIQQVGSPATAGTADYYSSNPTETRVSPIWFGRESSTPINIDANLYGHLIGQYEHIIHARSDNATWGQTVEVNGKTYMLAAKKAGIQTWSSETWWVEIGESES